MKLTKKQKAKIKLFIDNLSKDVSYRYGGWIWLGGKLIYNAFFMWLIFGFVKAFYLFVWQDYGITPDNIKTLTDIYYLIGLIWLFVIALVSGYEGDVYNDTIDRLDRIEKLLKKLGKRLK